MTYKDIIKALECCIEYDEDIFNPNICNKCPLYDDTKCTNYLLKCTLDLINQQRAEIKRLNKEIQITKDAYTMLQTKNEIIKLEAVKEFAARLKENISDDCHIVSDEGEYVGYDCGDVMHCIDNLVKEMVG